MAESILWLVGSDIAQRAVVNLEQVPVDNFDQWALSMALCGMDRDTLIAAVVDYHGEAAVKAHLSDTEPPAPQWAFPVGSRDYPPAVWYAATLHDLSGEMLQPLGSPRKHTGLDLNLAAHERGDVERRLGLSVYAITKGVVSYVTADWSGVPMLVVKHETNNGPLWARYAHVVPAVRRGDVVTTGDKLGSFANWRTGDHLHLDMAWGAFDREWLAPDVAWVDPVKVLKHYLDPSQVDAMIRQGDA